MNRPAPIPFWHRLSDISLYPLRGAGLVSIAVLSLATLLGYLPGIGFFLSIIVWAGIYRYAFEILVHTAHGKADAPEITAHTEGGVVRSFMLLWLIYFILVMLTAFFLGPIAALLVMLVLALLSPGAIISLAMDGVLLHAINPATSLAILSRIGAPYFAAFGLLFVIQISAAKAGAWLGHLLPGILADIMVTVATIWGLFATFHLMGYLVYQYHEALGFEPNALSQKPGLRTRDSDLMETVQEQLADGDSEAAMATLRAEMRERAVSIEAHELYRKLLRSQDDKAGLLAHASVYLNVLLLEKKERLALGLLRETMDAKLDFAAFQAEDGHRLALRARDLGQGKLACDLWSAMLKRWPNDPARVEWALALAPLLVQRDQIPHARAALNLAAKGLEDQEALTQIQEAMEKIPAF